MQFPVSDRWKCLKPKGRYSANPPKIQLFKTLLYCTDENNYYVMPNQEDSTFIYFSANKQFSRTWYTNQHVTSRGTSPSANIIRIMVHSTSKSRNNLSCNFSYRMSEEVVNHANEKLENLSKYLMKYW